MIEEEPNLNTGQPWWDSAIRDIEWSLKRKQSVRGIAEFLCRTEAEVREKAAELGYSVPAKTLDPRKRKRKP